MVSASVFGAEALSGVAAMAQAPITLTPYTSDAYGYTSVVPEGWTDVGRGIFARQRDAADATLIAQQSAPVATDVVLDSLLPQLGLEEAPESTGTHHGDALDWTLYAVQKPTGAAASAVDLALAENGGTTYIVLMQSAQQEHDALRESVFLPALDAFAPLEARQEPVPYVIEDVTFTNGDVTLAGTLTLPPTGGPYPAVLLVSGSGPQDRDETLGAGIAIKPFRLLADALTRAGMAVLRYDDRGVGKSTGAFETATVSDFAADAAAGVQFLLGRDDIDPDRVGLLGHSEGGLVAAMLGARPADLDFIIALAGPGVNGKDVLLLQNQRIFEAEGATSEQIDAQLAFLRELFTVLDDPQAMEMLIYEHTLEQAQSLPADQRAAIGDLEQYARTTARQFAEQYGNAWFKSFLTYDPGPDWAKTRAPVLAIFGGHDVQVDAAQNAPAVVAALAKGGNEDYEIVVLPRANHLFQEAKTGSPSEYATLPAAFTPDLVPTTVDWLTVQGVIGPAGVPGPSTPVASPEPR